MYLPMWFRKLSAELVQKEADVLLSVVYYVLVIPTAFIRTVIVKNNPNSSQNGWTRWSTPSDTIDELRKQY